MKYPFASALVLGLALVVTGASSPGLVGTVSAQAVNPCALLTVDEIEPLASTSVADGVSNSLPAFGYVACRYMWGVGIGRFKLDVIVTEPSGMFGDRRSRRVQTRLARLCQCNRIRKGPHSAGAPRRSLCEREEGSSHRAAEVGCVAAVTVLRRFSVS
jgi:hypothetical protein